MINEKNNFLALLSLHQMNVLRKQKRALETKQISEGTPWYMFVDPTTIHPLGQVQFQTEPDKGVCEICGEYDGDYYDFLDDSKPVPPLHPFCRCYYIYVPTGDIIDFHDQADYYSQ